jgi:hypothetical protein
MSERVGTTVGIIGSTAKAALWLALGALALGGAIATRHAFAQDAPDQAAVLGADELDKLVGRIALYPDDLVAVVLPASTYPLQVVQAARFIEDRKHNPNLEADKNWDDSIVALLNYPDVVKIMNDDLDWTWKLGDAVINQRADVLDAIQNFRDRAYAAGNLRTDAKQVVEKDDGEIAIKPADPKVIYVPYYEPEQVVVYQPYPVYHYYPYAYPVYYYPYPYGYPFYSSFYSGFFWGVSTAFVIGWHSHYVHAYPCGYYAHPYYGHAYHSPYYARYDSNVAVSRGGYVWEPHYRTGAQPFTRSNGRPVAVTRDGQRGGTYRTGDAASLTNDRNVTRSTGGQRGTPSESSVTRTGERPNVGGVAAPGSGRRIETRGQTSQDIREELQARRARSSGTSGSIPGDASGSIAPRLPGQYRNGSVTAPPSDALTEAPRQQPDNGTRQAPGGASSPDRSRAPGRMPGQYRSSPPQALAPATDASQAEPQRTLPAQRSIGSTKLSTAPQRYTLGQDRSAMAPRASSPPPSASFGGVPPGASSGTAPSYRGGGQPSGAPSHRGGQPSGSAPSLQGGGRSSGAPSYSSHSSGGRSSSPSGRSAMR